MDSSSREKELAAQLSEKINTAIQTNPEVHRALAKIKEETGELPFVILRLEVGTRTTQDPDTKTDDDPSGLNEQDLKDILCIEDEEDETET